MKRLTPKRLTPAAVSLLMVMVVGLLVTVYFAKRLLAAERKTSPNEARSLPVATETLVPGTELTPAHFTLGRARVETNGTDTAFDERPLTGRFVKTRIEKGKPIAASQLYPLGQRPPLDVAAGMRGVATPMRGGAAENELLQAGQFVDVHLTPTLDEALARSLHGGLTLTLFRGVRLLAITRGDSAENGTGSVTLELTPEQANVLILAREKGTIALSLNPDGRGDGAIAAKDGATLDKILQSSRGHDDETPAPRVFVSETYKGSRRTTRQFSLDGPVDASSDDSP